MERDIVFHKVTYITQKGLEKLEKELNDLRTIRRLEVAKYLQETLGDYEDTEYVFAQEEQAFIEGRIRQLQRLLSNVQVINHAHNLTGVVSVGSTVVVREQNQETETFTIVGAAEADPKQGLISNESPLGKALLGKQVGDELQVKVPDGLRTIRVLAVQ